MGCFGTVFSKKKKKKKRKKKERKKETKQMSRIPCPETLRSDLKLT